MAPTTRAQTATMEDSVSALKHLRCQVLGDEEVNGHIDAIFKTLEAKTISDFLVLEKEDYDEASASAVTKLSKVEIRKLLKAKAWYQTHPNSTKGTSTWFDLTTETFDDYLANGHRQGISSPVTVAPVTPPRSMSELTSNAAFDFAKSIKRDVSQYKEFSDDTKWVQWNRHLKSLAAVHGIENVLSKDYVPETPAEKALFTQQQHFAYSIFERCLKTAKSMTFVREFEHDHDAQSLYMKLLDTYESGITLRLNYQKAREVIQSHKLTSSWTKSLESFLVSFEHKLLDLEAVAKHTIITDDDRREWLTSAIQGHEHLYNATTTSQVVQNTLAKSEELSYPAYFALIRDLARVMDRNHKDKLQHTRKANAANTDSKPNKKGSNNKGNHRTPDNGFIDREKWRAMTKEQQEQHKAKWQKIRAERRAKSKTQRFANATQTTTNSSSSDTDTTSQNDAPPGSLLRSLLSANAANHSSKTVRLAPGTKVTIEGQVFTATMAQRTYKVSQHEQSPHPTGSLIDGGCNGGLAGEDVLVIEESLHRVDVTGIADSKIESVPICTVAGLIQATTGPLIAIFHQYAHYGKGKTIHSVNQLRAFGLDVNDIPKSCKGGTQSITTPEGFTIPLAIRDGLCYLDMRKPTDDEMSSFEHVLMTSDMPWNPQELDSEPEDTDFLDCIETADDPYDWVDCDDGYGEIL